MSIYELNIFKVYLLFFGPNLRVSTYTSVLPFKITDKIFFMGEGCPWIPHMSGSAYGSEKEGGWGEMEWEGMK